MVVRHTQYVKAFSPSQIALTLAVQTQTYTTSPTVPTNYSGSRHIYKHKQIISTITEADSIRMLLLQSARTKPLHRYSVLGWFHCTDTWPETVSGKVCFMLKFEKIDLYRESWWDFQDAMDRPTTSLELHYSSFVKTCDLCALESEQVMKPGWVCSHESCEQYNILDGFRFLEDAKRNEVRG